ncbi:3-oxoacyl-ACP reductase [Paenibacillus sp. WQ 127069]|uniref:3-oxoacyl-ACP reductase n=1 Tax=Paenibacillus baimaensis TaxID=2982185 RepID=A0ABT2UTL6_9BACL|nr:3-oxoacyl-ACP reductase [Paenibacillus sp. WQ 127069]MCU6798005.1 3-oxoacyl-ACP reductase [Paenibacillus sp. WQ 127069]
MLATLKFSKSSMRVQDFKLSDAGTHPNKAPFKCALFATDVPSDGPPGGAGGKKIRISSGVCDKNLHTFVGMALNIDYVNGMTDHDPRFKVAVIEKAYRSMDGNAWVEGYIYAKDFPDVVATIRYYNGLAAEHNWSEYQFGASLEMEAAVQDAEDGVLEVLEFCGTGAAILFAEAAAYKTTSFAAKNNKPKEVDVAMTPEQIKAMQDSMEALSKGMATITASVQTVVSEVGAIKTDLESVKAAKVDTEKKTTEETIAAELKAAQEKTAAVEKELADLKASKSNTPNEPVRKTLSASQLLSKHGGTSAEDATDIHTFCAAVDRLNLPPGDSLKLKMQARAELGAKENV